MSSDSFMADKNYVKWLSDLKKRFRLAQLKAAVKVNTEMLKFYWSLGEDICEKQKHYKWGAKVVDRLSLDMRSEFPQSEGFSRTNLFDIKRWFIFYSRQIEIVHQAGGLLQKWIIAIPQCLKYCFVCLGDTKRLLFPNALQFLLPCSISIKL